jgi:hypothetical protein
MLPTYSDCVYAALGNQHATRMCHIIICGFSGSATLFHFISYTARFSRTVTKHENCIVIFSKILSEIFLTLRRYELDNKNVCRSPCKVTVILVRFLCNLNYLGRYSKNTQISNFIKILPV